MSLNLKITEPTGNIWVFDLAPGRTYSIGRAKENDIVLNDRRVSRKHAEIRSEGENFVVVDGYIEHGNLIRSVNHVYVNGAPMLEKVLERGDVVTIGETMMVFGGAAVAAPISLEPQFVPPSQSGVRAPSGGIKATSAATLLPEKPKAVNYDDKPLGHTQMQLTAVEIMGRPSQTSIESALVTPAEIKDLRRKARMLELMYEMTRSIGTTFELKEIFEKATDLIFRGSPADRVVALIADETLDGKILGYSLYPVGVRTRDEKISKLTEKLTISRTITQKVMREKVALLSQDAKTDAQLLGSESIVSQGVRSTICAPLLTEANVHGVLYADRLDQFASFNADHLELISAVAAQTAVTVETVKAHTRLAREEVARANYSRFMPEYVVKQLLENPDSFRLGGVNQKITVLFADIRGFTTLAETEKPEKIVGLLNKYFSAMTDIIFEHGGTLDKYIGDELMALFGAPTASDEDALNAVKAAVTMQKRVSSLNDELTAEGFARVSIGIGLHTGEATVGYIGSDRRSEYTAIGDTVNTAKRLQSHAKGGQILMTDATAEASGNRIPVNVLEPISVKGRVQPVPALEVKWG